MKKENAETCHNALIEYQKKYGDEALTPSEKDYLYGFITYGEFVDRYTNPQDSPTKE